MHDGQDFPHLPFRKSLNRLILRDEYEEIDAWCCENLEHTWESNAIYGTQTIMNMGWHSTFYFECEKDLILFILRWL